MVFNKKRRSPDKGLTLTETVVVIGILSVLSVLLFGSVGAMRVQARSVQCAANLYQIGLALNLYALENGGHYPLTSHTTGSAGIRQAWVYQLKDYMSDFDRIRICPSDPQAEDRLHNNGTSYVLNSFVFVPAFDPFGNLVGEVYNGPGLLPDPGSTMLAFPVSDRQGYAAGSDHTHSEQWTSWGRVLNDIQPDRHVFGNPNDDHTRGTANYLFADGRVENIAASDFKALIDRGINPADPDRS